MTRLRIRPARVADLLPASRVGVAAGALLGPGVGLALSRTGARATAHGIGSLATLPDVFACVVAGAVGRGAIEARRCGTAWLSPPVLAMGITVTLGPTTTLCDAFAPSASADR